jgi:hypothetical protein
LNPLANVDILHPFQQSRNFALNPNEGLKIRPFKNAHTPEGMADRELDKLAKYMVHIATSTDDFRELKHKVSRLPFLFGGNGSRCRVFFNGMSRRIGKSLYRA